MNVAHNSGASLYFVLSKTIASKAEPNNFLKQHAYIALSMLCLIALCVIFWVNHFIAATGVTTARRCKCECMPMD